MTPHLTPRERECVELLSHGMTHAEIASRLGVGHRTVKTHLDRAMCRTGARNRVQLAVMYVREQQRPALRAAA